MTQQRFRYCVARYVPNVIRDEAVNVGVIVQDLESHNVSFRFLPRAAAVRRLWPDVDERIIGFLERQLSVATQQNMEFGLAGRPGDSEFLDSLAYEFTGTLQLTAPRGTTNTSLDSAVSKEFRTHVAEPGEFRPISYSILAPARLQRRVWNAFDKVHLIKEGAFLRRSTLMGKHSSWTFDLAMQENSHAQVINSLALNAPDPGAKAGRAFVLRGMVEDVRDSMRVEATAVIEAPKASDIAGFSIAESILADAKINIVHIGELKAFVADLERRTFRA